MRYSEGVEVNTIDAVGAQLVDRVQEKILDAAGHFGQILKGGHEPTVSYLTLDNVVGVDSFAAKESVV